MSNPVLRLVESPVEALADAGWVCVLVAALLATWWAATRNALYLIQEWQSGWRLLIPLSYAARAIGLLLIAAVDLWLLGALVAVLA